MLSSPSKHCCGFPFCIYKPRRKALAKTNVYSRNGDQKFRVICSFNAVVPTRDPCFRLQSQCHVQFIVFGLTSTFEYTFGYTPPSASSISIAAAHPGMVNTSVSTAYFLQWLNLYWCRRWRRRHWRDEAYVDIHWQASGAVK